MLLSTISFGIWALSLSAKLVSATATAALHKKQLAKAVSKERAKARLKRMIVAVPVVGTGAAIGFEANDLSTWLKQNPDKTADDYGCEVAVSSAEVIDEILLELPNIIRPSKDFVMGELPVCQANKTSN